MGTIPLCPGGSLVELCVGRYEPVSRRQSGVIVDFDIPTGSANVWTLALCEYDLWTSSIQGGRRHTVTNLKKVPWSPPSSLRRCPVVLVLRDST